MIAVIADDLTGAAELGGIGLRYNLQVEIRTEMGAQTKADLLIIALDTRSKPQHEAEKEIEEVSRKLLDLKPRFLYKKIDSVLRGHVLPEIKAQMRTTGKQRALIVSANPALDRTIINGIYYFKGNPIHQSSFANDPEFPILSSYVTKMVRAGEEVVHVLKHTDYLPDTGFIIGEVQNEADLNMWAKRLEPDILSAGAVGFFETILQQFNLSSVIKKTKVIPFQQPSLYVCGTTFQKTRDAIKRYKENGGPVSYLPKEIIQNKHPSGEFSTNWIKEIISLISQQNKAVIAIDPATTSGASAFQLREHMALAVAQLLQKTRVNELFLEGGSTAAAVLRKAGITRFTPVEQLATGVIRMRSNESQDLFFTLKPGSYDWPEDIPIY